MAKTMTPSESITSGQIGQIQDRVGTALRTSGLQSDLVQQVISTKGQGDLMLSEMVAVVRKFVEAKSKEIVRRVKVNRTLTPRQIIAATGRTQYVDEKILATMSKGEGKEVDVVFFKPEPSEYTGPRYISDVDLAKAFERRGLTPDPYAQAQVNTEDPVFADECPNGTHWKRGDVYDCVTFDRWRWSDGERFVRVLCDGGVWDNSWLFAGVRK